MTAPAPVSARPGTDEREVSHLVCCDANEAVCGEDVTEAMWGIGPDDILCAVCFDDDLPCPRCGVLP